MRHILNFERVYLYVNTKASWFPEHKAALTELVQRRLAHEPLAYILQQKEFFGVELYVDQRALVPRPETEHLVEAALELALRRGALQIADVGTGCGAVAVALALKLPQTKVYAIDISTSALEVAEANCRTYGLGRRVHLLQGNLLDPLPGRVDLIVANLPYVKKHDFASLAAEIRDHEPALALDGGGDGLWWIRQLLCQAPAKLQAGGSMLVEIGFDQKEAVLKLAGHFFPTASIGALPDLAGLDRVIRIETTD